MRYFKYIIAGLCTCFFSISAEAQQSSPFSASPSRKLQIAEFAISNLYVDQVDEDKLVETAIVKMLEQLDPHSTYSNSEEVKKLNEPLKGNFDGIGVQFNMSEDTLLIIQTVSGGPSQKAGIIAGDRIIMVNDTTIAGVKMSTEDIMSRLRGPKGSKVNLKILRRGVKELLPFVIKRDKIPVYSVDASYMIDNKIGYIKIDRFGATTHDEFKKSLTELQKRGMKDLIIDLQGNGGGYLDAAINIANELLDKKELIVYTEGKKSNRSEFFAKGDGMFKNGKLIVLVDEFSASASEIVTGAIQDWDRGLVVGRRSFGKGLVQRPIDLPDGSMIRLTVARYYTPAGRSIQKPYESIEKYNKDIIDRYNKGEMISADSIHFPDSLKYATQKLKRVVYGGGGIMPDYFVPIDTTKYTKYHRDLSNKGVIMSFHYKYIDANRKALKKMYGDFDLYDKKFEVTPAMLTSLVDECKKANVELNEKEYTESLPLLKLQLKALIARDLWDMNEYYHVINQTNESVSKAIELMKAPNFDELFMKKKK